MEKLSWYLGFIVILVPVVAISAEKPLLCYYGTWATYRHGNGRCDVSHLDPFLCTHLIYTFFGINEDGSFRIIDPYLDLEENWGRGNVKKFNDLKLVNPKLKTIAAVGGWNEGSQKFSVVAKDAVKRKRFVDTALEFMLTHGFDGLDMDWEYPSQREGSLAEDKNNFVVILQELKNAFRPYNLLLTAAVAGTEASASISYDIPGISKILDYVNLMAYELNTAYYPSLGHNAPLYQGHRNVDASVRYWLANGTPKEKLILGMPLYGRSFTLSSSGNHSIGAPHQGPGRRGPYTGEDGLLGYNEFCEQQLSKQWTVEWEPNQMVPYAYNSNQWVGYDNEKSIELKAKYVVDQGLGGAMVWSVETDDFLGLSGRKYPLLKTLKNTLNGGCYC